MDRNEINEKILKKIDMAVECISQTRDADFNDKLSCIICNLAAAYECLNK